MLECRPGILKGAAGRKPTHPNRPGSEGLTPEHLRGSRQPIGNTRETQEHAEPQRV
jgi:hypothetical protein